MTTKNRKKRRSSGTKPYLLKLPTETMEALEARAKKDATTVAALIRRAVDVELFAAGPLSISSLQQELEAVKLELAGERSSNEDYESSFALYDKASRALADAYKKAHPEFPSDAWPDATKVNVWAVEMLERIGQESVERVLSEVHRAMLQERKPDERSYDALETTKRFLDALVLGSPRWCPVRTAVCPTVPQCAIRCAELPPSKAVAKRLAAGARSRGDRATEAAMDAIVDGRVAERRWCENRQAVCPFVPPCVGRCAELPAERPIDALKNEKSTAAGGPISKPVSKRQKQIAKTVEKAKASIAARGESREEFERDRFGETGERLSEERRRIAASIENVVEPCKNCKHAKSSHWARGCVAGCNCSEKRFR